VGWNSFTMVPYIVIYSDFQTLILLLGKHCDLSDSRLQPLHYFNCLNHLVISSVNICIILVIIQFSSVKLDCCELFKLFVLCLLFASSYNYKILALPLYWQKYFDYISNLPLINLVLWTAWSFLFNAHVTSCTDRQEINGAWIHYHR